MLHAFKCHPYPHIFVLTEKLSTTHQKNGLPKKYTIAKLIKLPNPPYCNILTNKKKI